MNHQEIKKIITLMKPNLGKYITVTCLDAVTMSLCFNVMIAFVTKNIFTASTNGDYEYIFKALIMAGVAFIIGLLVEPIFKYSSNKIVAEMMGRLRIRIFKQLSNITISEFEKYHSGNLLSRVINDLTNIENLYQAQVFLFIFTCITGGIPLILIFFLEWKMGLIVLLFGILTLLANRGFAKKTRIVTEEIQTRKGRINEIFIDLLQSLTVTKLFQLEDKLQNIYKINNEDLSNQIVLSDRIKAQFLSLNAIFGNMNVIIILVGLFFITNGYMDIGTVMAVSLLQSYVNYLFTTISEIVIDMQNAMTSFSRIEEVFNFPVEKSMGEKAGNIEKGTNDVVIQNICFSYNSDKTIINNLSMNINAGTSAAIVGGSGSGKSTIIKLLLKFYDVDKGNILIGGIPLDSISYEKLRDKISYVSQNPYLFHGTIKENILFGKPDATNQEVIEAAKLANAHEFISSLPNGYESKVESGGENFSGGQRQRINIARAFLKNAPILILDEATSALDSNSEHLIQDALEVLMKGKTSIVIAHKLNTIQNLDTIFVLDQGRLVEKGTHEELINSNGIYASLYQKQEIN